MQTALRLTGVTVALASALVPTGGLGSGCDSEDVRFGPKPAEKASTADAGLAATDYDLDLELLGDRRHRVVAAVKGRDVRRALPRRPLDVKPGQRVFAVVPVGRDWRRVGWRAARVESVDRQDRYTVRLEEGRLFDGVPSAMLVIGSRKPLARGTVVRVHVGRGLPFGRVRQTARGAVSTGSVRRTRPRRPARRAPSTGSVRRTRPPTPARRARPGRPARGARPGRPARGARPTRPARRVRRQGPAGAARPQGPAGAARPARPARRAGPRRPTRSARRAGPTGPARRALSTGTAGSAGPTRPASSARPQGFASAVRPARAARPAQPASSIRFVRSARSARSVRSVRSTRPPRPERHVPGRLTVATAWLGRTREVHVRREEVLAVRSGLHPAGPVVYRLGGSHRLGSLIASERKHRWILGAEGVVHHLPWTHVKPVRFGRRYQPGDQARAAVPVSLRLVSIIRALDGGVRYEVGWAQTKRQVVSFSRLAHP